MLFICFVILFANVSFAGSSLSTDSMISLNKENVQLKDIITEIENKTDYLFIANNNVDLNQIVSVKCEDKSVSYALSIALNNTKIDHSIEGVNIILSNKKEEKKSNLQEVEQQRHQVLGVISDENNNPLTGVVITIKGTTLGVVTGINGQYNIDVGIGETLECSFIGYKTHLVKVGKESILNIKLEVEGLVGDEVVVVGFGTTKKSSLTGSISVVKADQLADRPVQSVAQALQGIVPGLNISVGDLGGELGANLNMNIRGSGSIGEGSEAGVLVLIDGMEGDMNTLNPQDIESFSIMKDAASATIYGSRAPFGVILITTKKGRQGKAVVNYNNSFRWSTPTYIPEMVDSWTYANYWNTAASNSGSNPYYSQTVLDNIQKYRAGEIDYATAEYPAGSNAWADFNDSWDDVDWFGVIFKEWTFAQEHNASVSGGTEKYQYYLSANYLDQTGNLSFQEDKYDRLSVSAKINTELASWAQINFTTRFIRTNYGRSSYQDDASYFTNYYDNMLYHNVLRLQPTGALIFPSNSDIPMSTINYGQTNDIAAFQYGGRRNTQRDVLAQQFSLVLEPIENWTITAELNYRINSDTDQSDILTVYYQRPDGSFGFADRGDNRTGNSSVETYDSRNNFMNSNIYTNYSKLWDSGHEFKATVGFQGESSQYSINRAMGNDIISAELPTLSNTTTQARVAGTREEWATIGFFGRLNYAYENKYLLEVSARYDGTSRFLKDQRWNIFPSVSAGWNMKGEDFLKDINAIDIIKIRGSWGQLGNQNTKSIYPFYQQLEVSKDHWWLLNDAKPSIYASAPNLVSQLLTWETVESWNIGVDFGFLNNRLTGMFEVFNRKTLNMVGPAPTLPVILGTSVPKTNNTDLVNKGWELELSWRDRIESINLSYGIRATLSDSRQFVTRYPNEIGDIYDWYNDKEAGTIWGYETIGIAQTDEQMNDHLKVANQDILGSKWGAGDIMYADLNGDNKVNPGESTLTNHGDLVVLGNSSPRYSYGISADIAWKGFDLSVFIQGVAKRDFAFSTSSNIFWGNRGNIWQSTTLSQHLDYWRPADDKTIFGSNIDGYYPKNYATTSDHSKNQKIQSRYIQDASYLRIKNLQVGYTISSKVSNKIALNKIRVFFSVDNLATFTELPSMFDPEVLGGSFGAGKSYPLSKVFSFGVNVTL